MKTLTRLLIVLLCCWGGLVSAQCGVQAYFTDTVNPNNVPVFQNQSTVSNGWAITAYQWNFGDGQISTQQNPSHVFAQPGVYYVCLYVTAQTANAPAQTCIDTFCAYYSPPCASGLQVSTAHQTGNGFVVYSANITGGTGPYTYAWSDGSVAQSVTVPFNQSGTYSLCVTVTDGSGCAATQCETATVTVSGCNVNMNAIFTASTTNSGTVFGANGNPSGTVYNWNFGDGTTATTTAPQTSHQYPLDSNTQIYFACLITSIPGTLCADTFCVDVVVPGVGTPNCLVEFTWQTTPNNVTYFIPFQANTIISGFWDFGDGSVDTSVNAVHTFPSAGTYYVCFTAVYPNCTNTVCRDVVVGGNNTDTLCGVVFNDANSNGVFDANETPLPAITIMAGNYTAVSDSDGFYQIMYPGTFAVDLHAIAPQGCLPTLPVGGNTLSGTNGSLYYVTPNSQVTGCGYNFGFNCNVVTVCGSVYFDADNNGTQDVGESGLSGVHVTVTGSNSQVYHAYTSNTGSYCVTVPAGTYTVNAAANNFNTCALTPSLLTVAATTVGQTYGNNNFAVYCQPGSCNLAITITPHTTVTPGFGAWYDVQVYNVGATVATGTANVFYDPSLTFNYASPAESAHNASTHTLSFNLPAMLPGDNEYYWLNFTASQSLALNTPVFTLANVISSCSDVNLTNNVDTIHQNVTGSWDPNNKLAYVTNYETNPAFQLISSIDANQRIEYVINFQNEGNGPAVNVVVKDLISSDLDISSFELLGTSHDCQVTLTGNDANFKFSNIMLPAKVTDEPNSHGFIKFAINAINNLPAGHVIADDAAIYFDFNEAVVTNESEVTLLEPTGIIEVNNVTATIAPNPMNQYATIRLNNNSNDGFKLRVTDVTGRIVSEQITSTNNLLFERNSLSAGMYTYQIIQNNKAVAKGKLVIQ